MSDIPNEIEQQVGDAFRKLSRRGSGVTARLLDAQQSIRGAIRTEAARLEAKLGPRDPRVVAIGTHLRRQAAATGELAVQVELLSITPVPIPDSGIVAEGRVADASNLGISGLQVCLVDADGAGLPDIGPQTTDHNGYYAIVLNPETLKRLQGSQPRGVSVSIFSSRGRHFYTSTTIQLEPNTYQTVNVRLDRFRNFEVIAPNKPGVEDLILVPDVVRSVDGSPILLEEAKAVLQKAGLQVGEVKPSEAPDNSTVVRQDPESGVRAAPGSPVNLQVRPPSRPSDTTVPEISRLTFTAARDRLTEAKLVIGRVAGDFDDPADVASAALVQAQFPAPGAEVSIETQVNLFLKAPGSQPAERGGLRFLVELASLYPGFDEIKNQPDALMEKLGAAEIENVEALNVLLEDSDTQLRERLRLRSVAQATAFRSVLQSVLKDAARS